MSTTEPQNAAAFIDVEEVIRKKNPVLLRILPGFLISYLKRILHQDEVNAAVQKYRDSHGVDFVGNILREMGISYEVKGAENIPRQGRYVFIANHPLGGLDGLVFIYEIGKFFPEVRFIVNDLLMNVRNMDTVFVPVNKHGRQSVEYARRIDETYASDAQVLYFPAGLCSRKKRGKIEDLEWKRNFLVKAIKYQRDVVPCFFSGRNSNFFYNLANLRTGLGIRSNIEMVYLPDEMFRQTDKNLVLYVGKPVPFGFFDKRFSMQEWTDRLKEYVYNLKESTDIPFPG